MRKASRDLVVSLSVSFPGDSGLEGLHNASASILVCRFVKKQLHYSAMQDDRAAALCLFLSHPVSCFLAGASLRAAQVEKVHSTAAYPCTPTLYTSVAGKACYLAPQCGS